MHGSPLKLRIGAREWTVKFYPSLFDEDEKINGITLLDKREIHIEANLPVAERELFLLHEVLHATLFETGHSELFETEGQEEGLVRALSHALYPLIHKNKLKLQK